MYHRTFENFIDNSQYYSVMLEFVDKTTNLCPTKDKVFRFLEADLSKLRCIILGMDPYPSTYLLDGEERPVATGRAFEVENIMYWTDKYKQISLTNIFKALCYLKFGKVYSIEEIRKNVNLENFKYLKVRDWFDAMEREGVMFLNATLTTIKNKSGEHIKVWTHFMNELLRYIVDNTADVKWLIWGESARSRVENIVSDKNIIYTCHPATRNNNTFVKDCCFKRIKNIMWV